MVKFDDFRQSLKPLIIINSIFSTGLIEYFIDLKINLIGFIYVIIGFILYITVAYTYTFNFMMIDIAQQVLVRLLYKLYIINDIIFYIVSIIAGILRRKEIRRLTIQIETCVKSMNQLNIPMNLSKYFWQQCLMIIFLIVNVITFFFIDIPCIKTSKDNYWKLCIFLYLERYPCLVLYINDLTYLFWMRYIKTKLNELNKLLQNMLTTSNNSPQHKRVLRVYNNNNINNNNELVSSGIYRTYKSNEEIIKIKKIREIHLELTKCARNINDAYGIHVLMSITTAFILITAVAYNLYFHLISKSYRTNIYESFMILHWILFFSLKIILISWICTKTITEIYLTTFVYLFLHVKNTGDILCELYEPSISKEFRAEIRDFIIQLIQNPLSLTTCGFFSLDHTLISNVISTVTTYLVILIQVGNVPAQFYPNSTILTTDL